MFNERKKVALPPLALLFALLMDIAAFAEERVVCPPGEELDAYRLWQDVDNDAEAKELLIETFEHFQDIKALARWLSCQGFGVSILRGPSRPALAEGETHISAVFMLAPSGRKPLWDAGWLDAIFRKHAHTFEIFVSRENTIEQIVVGLTVK